MASGWHLNTIWSTLSQTDVARHHARGSTSPLCDKTTGSLTTGQSKLCRIAELQAHHQQRHDVTVDGLTTQLEASRKLAMDEKQPAAATGAVMAMARLHGLDRGEGNVEVKVTQTQVEVSDLEVARRLERFQ